MKIPSILPVRAVTTLVLCTFLALFEATAQAPSIQTLVVQTTNNAIKTATSDITEITFLPAMPTADYKTLSGKEPGAPPESPGLFRLLTATSADGITYTATNTLIMDQSNVPDLVMDAKGWIYLYFAGAVLGTKKNTIGLAISTDGGKTWTFKNVTLTGNDQIKQFGDPDVIILPDGRFRLFTTCQPTLGSKIGIVYAESFDGVNFTYKGIAAAVADNNVEDSSTFLVGDVWHLFALNTQTNMHWHFSSKDGTAFTLIGQEPYRGDSRNYVLSNGYTLSDGSYRMIGFSIPEKNFRSFLTTNVLQWTTEPTICMKYTPGSALESTYIKDPAILKMPDGSYFMVYVSLIP
jgi:hypothetical protein